MSSLYPSDYCKEIKGNGQTNGEHDNQSCKNCVCTYEYDKTIFSETEKQGIEEKYIQSEPVQSQVTRKLFVIDTNVLLYDHTAIYNFEEHDIVIPIVVLEEIDVFKKGNDLINYEARSFIRELDKLSGDNLLTNGVPLGEGKGRLFVEVADPDSSAVDWAFSVNKPDHRILNAGYSIWKKTNSNIALLKL